MRLYVYVNVGVPRPVPAALRAYSYVNVGVTQPKWTVGRVLAGPRKTSVAAYSYVNVT